MKRATVLMGLLAMAGLASAKETVIKPQIESAGLFKNGLCAVKGSVKGSFAANEPGEFLWNDPPRAVHGTFLVESGGPVAIRSTLRKVVDAEETAVTTGNLRRTWPARW